MPKIAFQIETTYPDLPSEFVKAKSPAPGVGYPIPEVGTLIYQPTIKRKSLGGGEIFEFVLTFSSGVASGVVANWLYSTLRSRVSSLTINRVEVQIDEGEIKRVIEEQISQTF